MEQKQHGLKLPGETNDALVERVKREADERNRQRSEHIPRPWKFRHWQQLAFLKRLKEEANLAKIEGWLEGWWELDEDGNMAAPLKKFKISDFPKNAVMAHVVAAAGIFPSVSQARKNGHDKPLVTGEFVLTKKKIRIIVVDE